MRIFVEHTEELGQQAQKYLSTRTHTYTEEKFIMNNSKTYELSENSNEAETGKGGKKVAFKRNQLSVEGTISS